MGAPFNGSDNTASKSVIAASGFDTAMVRLAVLPPLSEYWRWREIALTKIKSLIRVLCFFAPEAREQCYASRHHMVYRRCVGIHSFGADSVFG